MASLRETRGLWSTSEHERFLEAIALYPQGPWLLITAHIGTRSAKQVQTHAQKYQHKLLRHRRGLRKWKTKTKRPEHRVDSTTAGQLMNTKGWIIGRAQIKCSSLRPANHASSGADDSASESSEDSDWSTQSDLEAVVAVIEPVPFQSTKTVSYGSDSMRSDDHVLLEALAVILSWPTCSGSPAVDIDTTTESIAALYGAMDSGLGATKKDSTGVAPLRHQYKDGEEGLLDSLFQYIDDPSTEWNGRPYGYWWWDAFLLGGALVQSNEPSTPSA